MQHDTTITRRNNGMKQEKSKTFLPLSQILCAAAAQQGENGEANLIAPVIFSGAISSSARTRSSRSTPVKIVVCGLQIAVRHCAAIEPPRRSPPSPLCSNRSVYAVTEG
ncbi:chaperonin [Sesbania bispinosa]|nr:chaperonin [Sesbania bispinosa]